MPASVDGRMSPLVKRLRRQIAGEKGFACFAEQVSVEQVLFAYAHSIGVPVTQLLAEWAGRPASEVPRKPTPPPALSDDGDDMECPDCDGSGTDESGGPCPTCGGSGRVVADDRENNEDDGDIDDDDEDERKGFRYEFEEE